MNKAHEIQLNPTKAQKVLIGKSCGCARHSFNWALAKWQELYKQGEKPSAYSLIKLQNSIKKEEMPFYLDVNKCAVQYAIHNVEAAYKKMWKEKSGYPKFKKKGSKDSFVAVENSKQFKQKDKKIWLPRIGWVKCYEDLRFCGKVNNVVVKIIVDKCFAVINMETIEAPAISENQAVVGVDFGIKTMAFLSNGVTFENPKALKSNLKSLKRLQRGLNRKEDGSANRKKQQQKLAKKHYKISCIRKNATHKLSSHLVNNFGKIVIEDLNVSGILKNRKLSQSIHDVSFGEIRRQLTYKCKWKGVELVVADRFYPSSKLCSCCGHKKEVLRLSERIYKCSNCGISLDRDFNASLNLKNYTLRIVQSEVTPVENNQMQDLSCGLSMNQEINKLNNNFKQIRQIN